MNKAPVLVVDDDADIREALCDALADEGYSTAAATNGSDALAYLRANPPPSLILLDWNMAPMNAPQFMAALHEAPEIPTVPVILVTADARAPDKAKLKGFVGYLKKPVHLEDLFELIQKHATA